MPYCSWKRIRKIEHAFVVPSYLEVGIQDRKVVVISDPSVHNFYPSFRHSEIYLGLYHTISHMNKSDLYSIDLSWPENLNGFKDASRIFSGKFRQLMLPGSVYRIFHIFSWKRLWLFIVANNNKKLSFSFVSLCSHVWCRSRRFDCILLVFFRRWGRLVMRDLIEHDALLWLVFFQQLWLVHFDPCCPLCDLLPRRSAVARLSCCCVSWSWASTLLEFLFHYPCWCC